MADRLGCWQGKKKKKALAPMLSLRPTMVCVYRVRRDAGPGGVSDCKRIRHAGLSACSWQVLRQLRVSKATDTAKSIYIYYIECM